MERSFFIKNEMKLTEIDKNIICTLCYGDVKSWPMTNWEIFRYFVNRKKDNSLKKPSLGKITQTIQGLKEEGVLEEENGFYFLKKFYKDSESLALKRIEKEKLSDRKIKKAIKITEWLETFPFVRGVFLSGSLAFGWSREESDIDVLVIVRKGHIWTARFLLSGVLTILGLKRSKKHIKDRICLNHFITTNSLHIDLHSLYNAETYSRLIPLYMRKSLLAEFIKENQWIKKYVALGSGKYFLDLRQKTLPVIKLMIRSLLEVSIILIGGFAMLEKILGSWQIRRIKKDPRTHKKGGRVTVDHCQIEFHPSSPEKKHIREYNKRVKKLGLFDMKPEKDSGLI